MPPRVPLAFRCRNKPVRFLLRYPSRALPLSCSRLGVRYQTSTTRIIIRPQILQSIQSAIDRIQQVLHKLDLQGYSSSPRIRLATRGLQQPDAPVRLAVTGPHAHTLLAALLQPEPQEPWVSELSRWVAFHKENPTAGLILRYGPRTQQGPINRSFPSGLAVVNAPIEVLRTNALEILVAPGIDKSTTTPAFYMAEGGRLIDFPVHKAIEYVGSGQIGLARLVSAQPLEKDPQAVLRVISLPESLLGDAIPSVMVVRSLDGADIDNLRSWMFAGTTGSPIKSSVIRLVDSILHNATSDAPATSTSPTSFPVQSISSAIISWSIGAHRAIRCELEDAGFRSSTWANVEWWKLLWRADDVGHIARHIVSTQFLRQPEKDAAFLAGQIRGAGLNREGNHVPQYIDESREEIIKDFVDGLQIAAQRCLLRSLEVSIGTSALAGLIALSGSGTVVAGGLASAGIIYGAWSLRRGWGREKLAFEQDVRERARRAVMDTERWAWDRIQAGHQKSDADLFEEQARQGLLSDIEQARIALDSLLER